MIKNIKNAWILAVIALVIVLPIAWYLISPAFRVVEAQDESPLDFKPQLVNSIGVMDAETKAKFEKQSEEMKGQIVLMDDKMPSAPKVVAEGIFEPGAHEVMGKALLIANGNKKIFKF